MATTNRGAKASKTKKTTGTVKKSTAKSVSKSSKPAIVKSKKTVSKGLTKPKSKPAKAKTTTAKTVTKTISSKTTVPKSKTTNTKTPVKAQLNGKVKVNGKTVKKESKPINKPTVVKKKEIASGSLNVERGRAFSIRTRPQAIIHKQKEEEIMGEEKQKYSEEELKEFEVLIMEKLDKAKRELNYMKEMLSKKNDEGTDNTAGTLKLLEDGADTLEKENFSQLAARQQKFVTQLENAMARIKNGTYGICIETGKLIPKERLRAVPHTQHSIEAKLNRRD